MYYPRKQGLIAISQKEEKKRKIIIHANKD